MSQTPETTNGLPEYETLIDGSPHPAAAFTDPLEKWTAHLGYISGLRKRRSEVFEGAREFLGQVSRKRIALEESINPSDERQLELIRAFDVFNEQNVEHWIFATQSISLTTEEALEAALAAINDIAEMLRKGGKNVSFTSQRARRRRLKAIAAEIAREATEFHSAALSEKEAMQLACPDFERLSPKFIVVSSADPECPPGTVVTL